MPYQTVGLDVETYDALKAMAQKNDRKIIDQIRFMLKTFQAMDILEIETLPHPADAHPIPVIKVNK
jgi:hypothetical protein